MIDVRASGRRGAGAPPSGARGPEYLKEVRMRTRPFPGLAVLLVLAAVATAPGTAAAQSREIVFSGYGGDYGEMMKKLVIEPFEKKFNAKVVYDATGTSAQKLAKLRASRDTYTWDATVLTGYDLLAAGREGLLEPVDATKLPNLAKLWDFAQKEGQGWGPITSVDPLILLYNRDRVKPPPDSWNVLWDPRYKGKVAISHVSEGKGLFLLLLAAYMTGGDERRIDSGFAKVRELVPNVGAWLTLSPQYVPYFQREDVWLTPYWNGRAQLMIDQGLPLATVIPKEGTLAITNAFGVAKSARNKALALEFVNFYLDAAQQEAWVRKIYYGPTNREVAVPPEYATRVPVGIEAINRLRFPDEDHLAKTRGAWVERWNKEIYDALKYAK
jgi:putative spermidine/putrescine transport system substrate-binding protein